MNKPLMSNGALNRDQFQAMMGLNKPEPVTSFVASGLNAIKQPLDYYAIDKRVPLVGGQSIADLIGLTGTQSLVQDFSQGKPMMRDGLPDERFIDAASMIPMIKPAAVATGQAAKSLGKEALRQGYEGTGVLGMIAPDIKMPITEFEIRQLTAQKNAALPYSEGGLNLSPNNTAMQRARAMGFETQPSKEMYHYARQGWDSNKIDPSKSDLGFHTGTIKQANHRGNVFMPHEEGGNIMPLMKSKYANMLKVNDEGTFHADSFSPQLEKKGLVSKGHTKKIMADPLGETSPKEWDLRYDQQMRDILAQNDYHGVKYNNAQEGEGISYAFTDPTIVRSRFAAFDPFRRNENDILAGVGVGIPVSSGLLNIEEKKEPKKAKKKSK